MNIYIYEGYKGGKEFGNMSETLLKYAAGIYFQQEEIKYNEDTMVIDKTENGKPYFPQHSTNFSISHSQQLWICAISTNNVGIDIQIVKNTNWEKISNRYFSEEEQHFCQLWGIEGFFSIWVRKEAIVKYLGTTLGEGLSKYNTVSNDEFLKYVTVDEEKIILEEIEISPDIKCAVAKKGKDKLCVMTLN